MKPPSQDLLGGALAPIWSYGEVLVLVGSHPRTVTHSDPDFGTMMPSLRLLASS
jgi:hypothetical protein